MSELQPNSGNVAVQAGVAGGQPSPVESAAPTADVRSIRKDDEVTPYLALLRGINVSRNQRIAMADLRALLTDSGLIDVTTYLQSGNALFRSDRSDPDAIAADIEAAVTRELDLTVRVLVRDGTDLRRVMDADPLADVATEAEPGVLREALPGGRPRSGYRPELEHADHGAHDAGLSRQWPDDG